MRRILSAAVAAVMLLALTGPLSGIGAAGEERADSPDRVRAAESERLAAQMLPGANWEVESLRALARGIAALPDDVALAALWQMASAPPRLDTINVFANALQSPSVAVRCVAVSALAAGNTEDTRRLLLNSLALEQETEVVLTVVKSIAGMPKSAAVRFLMDVMFLQEATDLAVEATAEELRRLTKAEIANNPADWRDWWLDHEPDYE